MIVKKIFKGFFFMLFFILAVAVFGFFTMKLWNALMPDIFKLPALSFWQATGLLVLARVLFSSFGRWGGRHHRYCGGRHYNWRQRMEEKLSHMSPEEKEKFLAKMKGYCGHLKHEKYNWQQKETSNDTAS